MTADEREPAGRTPLHSAVVADPTGLPNIAAQTDPALKQENDRKANEYKLANTKALLDAGADVDATDVAGMTPLHFAAAQESVDVVQLLLDAGAQVDIADHKGETPLYRAVRNTTGAAAPIAQLLLDRGADPNAPLANGSSPLSFVRRFQKPGLVEVFARFP